MTETPRLIQLDEAEPQSHDPGVTDREVEVEGVRWALVEYVAGASRARWCSTPHSGFVLAGAIMYEFEDGREPLVVSAGSGLVLPAEPRHRGRNEGAEVARLFLVDAWVEPNVR